MLAYPLFHYPAANDRSDGTARVGKGGSKPAAAVPSHPAGPESPKLGKGGGPYTVAASVGLNERLGVVRLCLRVRVRSVLPCFHCG